MGWDAAFIIGIYAAAYSLAFIGLKLRVREFNKNDRPDPQDDSSAE